MLTEEQHTRFEDLRLLPGQALQLDFNGYTSERDRATLIGYRSGQSIIVSTPMLNGLPMPLKLGASLTVRLFASQLNSACAFRTEVLHIARAPYPHLHLALPERLALGEVRSSVRAKVSLISSVYYGEGFASKTASLVKDISLGGCCLNSPALPVEVGDTIRLTAQVSVSGIERIVSLDAQVRSQQEDDAGTVAGVQFIDMSDSDRITLHAYVLSNIHAH